jgi:hypothetical protein
MNQNTKENKPKDKTILTILQRTGQKTSFWNIYETSTKNRKSNHFAYKVITNAYGYTKNLKGNLLF